MKVFAVLFLVAAASSVAVRPRQGYVPVQRYFRPPSYSPAPYTPVHTYKPAPRSYQVPSQYGFDYSVKDYAGNDFGHHETKNGYQTSGVYYVQLPDGRRQKVTYRADKDSGYVAEVTYEGEARYPTYQPTYKPTYHYKPVYKPSLSYKPAVTYG